jgi:Leucine-rich repeat (LRR) protein
LEGLEMASVQLDEFSDDEIYEALPELNHLNVAHNNLRNIPKSNFQGRDIFYMSSYDNPASPGSTFSCYPDLFFDACSRSHSNAMTFIHHHPVGFTLGAATLLPSLFLGPLYLEHGPLLWEYFRLLQRGASNALWGVSLK